MNKFGHINSGLSEAVFHNVRSLHIIPHVFCTILVIDTTMCSITRTEMAAIEKRLKYENENMSRNVREDTGQWYLDVTRRDT